MTFWRRIDNLVKSASMKERGKMTVNPTVGDDVNNTENDTAIRRSFVGRSHEQTSVNNENFEFFTGSVCASAGPSTVRGSVGQTDASTNDLETGANRLYVENQKRNLLKLFTDYRRTENLIESYKSEVEFLGQEIDAVSLMLQSLAVDEKTLENIRSKQLQKLHYLLNVDSEAIHGDIKKKESLFYRKYSKANTSEDLKSFISLIRSRQVALKHLELLTYKKLINLKTVVKETKPPPKPVKITKFEESTEGPAHFHVTKKPTNPGFMPLPWSWEEPEVASERKWEPPRTTVLQTQV